VNCPVCKDTVLLISDRNGIEIDYCPKCRGVWLDRGEFDKIIEKTESVHGYEKKDYDKNYYNDRDYKYKNGKKRGGLLGELFDF